jgi:hypothetical protein
MEELQVKTIAVSILLSVFWSAFYTLTNFIKDERYVLIAFTVCLVISMVTAVAFLVEQKK